MAGQGTQQGLPRPGPESPKISLSVGSENGSEEVSVAKRPRRFSGNSAMVCLRSSGLLELIMYILFSISHYAQISGRRFAVNLIETDSPYDGPYYYVSLGTQPQVQRGKSLAIISELPTRAARHWKNAYFRGLPTHDSTNRGKAKK